MLILLAGGSAAAETQPRPLRVAVDFAKDGWYAGALEEMVGRELSRFGSLEVAGKVGGGACAGRDARCLVDAYREAGVDVVVLGRVERNVLGYEVYATWARGRAFDGTLAVAHVDAATLRRHVGEIVRPIVQRGGLGDERTEPATGNRQLATGNREPGTGNREPETGNRKPETGAHTGLLVALLVALMGFVAVPPLLAWLLVGAGEIGKRGRPASWKWSAVVIGGLGSVLAAAMLTDLPAMVVERAGRVEPVTAVVAGMIWGAFVLVHASWVFSPIHGLGQARHDAIWPLLQSWLALAFLRALALVVYVPVIVLVLVGCDALGLPRRATWMLAVPSVGLLAYFWLLTLVDNLALYLDVHLVAGAPTARNPWHATIKRYFRGYVRRNGVELDAALFERTLFLPSLLPGVVSYGGGFARPRVLVGELAREAALGQLPDETELPERTVNPEELPFGFLAPTLDASPHGSGAEERRHALTLAPARARGAAPRALGETTTLLGWVMPQPDSDGVPLIANGTEELDLVWNLLTAHYADFMRDFDGDEIDDTDPTQKDFLFGALLREMGVLGSHDTFLATLRLSFGLAGPKASGFRRWLIAATIGLYDRFLSGPAARVADAEVALNQGLHHLIQYLSFVRGGADAWLTVRANAPRLIQTSKDLLEYLDRAAIPTVERQALAATPRNRLLWLSRLFHAPLGRRADRGLRVAAALLFMVVAGGALLFALRDAIDYHPTYVERMQGASSDERTTKQ